MLGEPLNLLIKMLLAIPLLPLNSIVPDFDALKERTTGKKWTVTVFVDLWIKFGWYQAANKISMFYGVSLKTATEIFSKLTEQTRILSSVFKYILDLQKPDLVPSMSKFKDFFVQF